MRSASSSLASRASSASPASVAARSTTPSGRASVPVGSETATPVRAEPKSSARTFTRASSRRDDVLRGSKRIGDAVRVLAARLGERRLPSPAPADVLAELAHDLHGVEPALDERLVEIDDEEHPPVVARRDDGAVGLLLLADPVREVPKGPALEALHLDEEDVALLVLGDDLRPPTLLRALRFLASVLELAAQRVGLARALVQQRERRTCGHGLDPARPGADRAFGEDGERADLGGRPHMRTAAELERPAVDIDHPHDVAVLLAEEHHRAEVLRLRQRRLEDPHRLVREHVLVDASLDL